MYSIVFWNLSINWTCTILWSLDYLDIFSQKCSFFTDMWTSDSDAVVWLLSNATGQPLSLPRQRAAAEVPVGWRTVRLPGLPGAQQHALPFVSEHHFLYLTNITAITVQYSVSLKIYSSYAISKVKKRAERKDQLSESDII